MSGIKRLGMLRRDERGAGALEFALAAPIMFTFVIGIAQLGIMFFANSGVQHAVEEAARVAAVFPRPDDATIRAKLESSKFGNGISAAVPTLSHGTTADCLNFTDVSLSYEVPLDFIFFEVDPVRLSHTRRVFTFPDPAPACTPTGGGGTTSASSTSTSSTTTSSTSTGGDASTSTGGDDSTSGGDVVSTSSTTTSGGGNGSSGNNNNGSSGNGNGSSGNNKGSSGK